MRIEEKTTNITVMASPAAMAQTSSTVLRNLALFQAIMSADSEILLFTAYMTRLVGRRS
ncbi:MAG TPA: hypothetical protein VKO16_13875 [Polyangia bacterium]|nr:hypothetical protein [Polyangia bacterium]